MNQEFWKNRRVLITGHTGFKGSWLSLWLKKLGAKVTGYALAPQTKPSLFELTNVAQGMDSFFADIRNLERLQEVFKKSDPEFVFHLAAQPLVRLSYEQPVETYATNIMGTVNILEAMRLCKNIKAAIIVTSDKCYENRGQVEGYTELEPMGGSDPYSSSKGCAELVAAAYRTSFFNSNVTDKPIPFATARAGNVIGGGDWSKDRLIPDLLSSIQRKETLLIRNPNAVRPWQHVLESLSGYLLLAEHLANHGEKFAEGWNFGPSPDDAKPVQWIVKQLFHHLDMAENWKTDDGSHPHEAHYLSLDSTKARKLLGWIPRWELEQALKVIAKWHQAYQGGENMEDVTLKQIDLYQETEICKLVTS